LYESLTSYQARNKLHELKTEDPELWNSLTTGCKVQETNISKAEQKEDPELDPPSEDDSDLVNMPIWPSEDEGE
jgi:hypothetical protein